MQLNVLNFQLKIGLRNGEIKSFCCSVEFFWTFFLLLKLKRRCVIDVIYPDTFFLHITSCLDISEEDILFVPA